MRDVVKVVESRHADIIRLEQSIYVCDYLLFYHRALATSFEVGGKADEAL